MKSFIQKIWMLVVFLSVSISATAYDFEADGIGYTITDFSDLTVSVSKLVNDSLTKVNIPEYVEYKDKSLKVTSIAKRAFRNDSTLLEISLPVTINSIGDEAFYNNFSLTAVNLPESLTYIGKDAFYRCESITSISIPDGIYEINDYVFCGCISLKEIDIHSNIHSIGAYAFASTGLQRINIPDNVISIGKGAFSYTDFVDIRLHDGIKIIPDNCFKGCDKLRNIIFKSEAIGSYAFKDCIALEKITIPESVTTINDGAFQGCESIKEFVIPSSVTYIAPTILWDCPNLETLQIGSGLNGLPVIYDHESSYGSTAYYRYYSLGSYVYGKKPWGGSYQLLRHDEYLKSIRTFIIDDSEDEFRIRGFQWNYDKPTPPFADNECVLDYYYVGRPLTAIENWSTSSGGSSGFAVDIKQGTGRIRKLEINGSCTSVPYFYQKVDTLKLGEKIREFSLYNIYKEDIVKIECLSKNPPKCVNSYYSFPTNVYTDAVLYVPFGCKEAYANADVWKNFWNIYELSEDNSLIEEVYDEEDLDLHDIYNLSGVLIGKSFNIEEIKKLPKGIYIVTNKYKKYKIKI